MGTSLVLKAVAVLSALLIIVGLYAALQHEEKIGISNAITVENQGKEIKQKDKNTAAVKTKDSQAQQDKDTIARLEQRIKELDRSRFLNNEESATARSLIWYFNCAGVSPIRSQCSSSDSGILQSTGEAVPVSIGEFIESCESIAKYSHRWEETGQCWEKSVEVVK